MNSAADRNGAIPLRVMFVIRSLDVGGAERQLVLLARGLQEAGHDVTLCSAYLGGTMACELDGSGVRRLALGQRTRADFPRLVWRVRAAIDRYRPDVVHGYMPTSNILVALATPHRRAAIVWGVRASDMQWERYGKAHQFAFQCNRALAARADLVIANSQAGVRFHVGRGFPADRTTMIPNGIDVNRFHPDPFVREETRRSWGVTADTTLLGMVARLDRMKDHRTLIDAVATLHRDGRPVRLVCVGDGPAAYAELLRRHADAAGLGDDIIWQPARDHAASIYPAFDIAVSSSRFGEGFSNALGEAMACGVPCVATDVGDARLVLGDTGRVVPRVDADALAGAIAEVMRADRLAMGGAARARVVERFAVARLVSRTAEVLADVRRRHQERHR